MRVILILALIVIAMALLGWLTFYSGRSGVGVTVETQKIQQDAARLMEKSEQAFESTERKLQEVRQDGVSPDPVRESDRVPENEDPLVVPNS